MFKDDELKLAAIFIAAVVTVIVTTIVVSHAYYAYETYTAMSQGYSQQVLPGESGVHWVKDGQKLQ